jgi:hypothetical protein
VLGASSLTLVPLRPSWAAEREFLVMGAQKIADPKTKLFCHEFGPQIALKEQIVSVTTTRPPKRGRSSRENRHMPVRQQHETLRRKVQGHINYYGVNGNIRSLQRFVHQATRSWYKWLNRRSQRARLTWERFEDLLGDLPLPKARIVVSIWR